MHIGSMRVKYMYFAVTVLTCNTNNHIVHLGILHYNIAIYTARAILLDLCLDSYTCLNIQDALSSTLSLILQLQGAPRLTHLSLILLGDHPKVSSCI